MSQTRSGDKGVPLRIVSSRQTGLESLAEATSDGAGFRLMIIDPRALSRDCLVAALEATRWFAQITPVDSVPAAIEELKRVGAPDVVVLNLASDSFDNGGLQILAGALRTVASTSGFVILASRINKLQASTALGMGVRGFLDSDTPLDIATEAIRFVARGWMVYPAFDFSDDVITIGNLPEDDLWQSRFTARQKEVLNGLERGLTNGRIAATLKVSERTVKAHVKEIMRRVGATNRTQVVVRLARMRRTEMEPAMDQPFSDI